MAVAVSHPEDVKPSILHGFESVSLLREAARAIVPLQPGYFRGEIKRDFTPLTVVGIDNERYPQYLKAIRAFFQSSVSLALAIDLKRADPTKHLEHTVGRNVNSDLHAHTSQVVSGLLVHAAARARDIQDVRDLASRIVPAFDQEVGGSTAKSFQIVELLSASPRDTNSRIVPTEEEEVLALLWTLQGEQDPCYDQHHKSRARLNEGQFDSILAAEVLEASTSDLPKPSNSEKFLKHYIELFRSALGVNERTVIASLSQPEAIEQWWPEAKQALSARRQLYADQIANNADLRRLFLRQTLLILPKSSVDVAKRQLLELDTVIRRTFKPKPPTKAERVKRNVEQRRDNVVAPEPLPEQPSRRLLFGIEGEEKDMAGDHQNPFEKYIAKHKGDRLLIEDVDLISGYLVSKPFKDMVANEKVKGIDGNLYGNPVWEFKPKDVNGLSLKSYHGKKMRVLWSRTAAGDILIHDVIVRRDLSAAFRKLRNRVKIT